MIKSMAPSASRTTRSRQRVVARWSGIGHCHQPSRSVSEILVVRSVFRFPVSHSRPAIELLLCGFLCFGCAVTRESKVDSKPAGQSADASITEMPPTQRNCGPSDPLKARTGIIPREEYDFTWTEDQLSIGLRTGEHLRTAPIAALRSDTDFAVRVNHGVMPPMEKLVTLVRRRDGKILVFYRGEQVRTLGGDSAPN